MESCSGTAKRERGELARRTAGLTRVTEQHATNWLIKPANRKTDRRVRNVVFFPGEGAVESLVERLAVLLVPFDSSQYHLRVSTDLGG